MPAPKVHPDLVVQLTDPNGQPYEEYYDAHASQESGAMTYYLEACSGSEFEIRYWLLEKFPRDQPIAITTYIDGAMVRRDIAIKDVIAAQRIFGHWVKSVRFQDGKEWLEQRFRFADPNLSVLLDHDETRSATDLGTIKIEFRFATVLIEHYEPESIVLPEQHRAIKKEEPDETKSLRVEPGTTFTIQKPDFYGAETEPEAFTTFVWKYCSREDLEEMGGVKHLITLAYPANWPDTKDETDVKGKDKVKEEVKHKKELRDEKGTTRTKEEPELKKERADDENTAKPSCFGGSVTLSPSDNIIQNVKRQREELANTNTASEPGKTGESVKGDSDDGGDVKIKEEPKD